MTKEEYKKIISKILGEKVIHIGIQNFTEELEYVEVEEVLFENLAKLNEKYSIELIEGYNTDNITIFFK